MVQHKRAGNFFSNVGKVQRSPGLWIPDQDDHPVASTSTTAVQCGTPPVRLIPPSEHVQRRLRKLVRERIRQSDPPAEAQVLRFPVALFFTRDRGAGIRDEIASSFEFWSRDSGEYFDMFFPGWYFHNDKLRFNLKRFMKYRQEIEGLSLWAYSGETDLLILNFNYDLQTGLGEFDFTEVITLPVEEMIREKRIGSLAVLLSHIHNAARKSRKRGKHSAVWEISDGIGFLRGRQSLWEALKKIVLKDFAQVYDNVRPFGVRDLRRRSSREMWALFDNADSLPPK